MSEININKPTEYILIDNNKKYLPSRFVFVPTICLTSDSETIENVIAEQTYYNVENDDFVCKITHKYPSELSSRIVCKTDDNNVYVCKYTKSDGGIEYVACSSKNLELDNVLSNKSFDATNVMVKMSLDGQNVALSYFYDTPNNKSLKHIQTDNSHTPYIQIPSNYDSLEINTNNIFYKDEKISNQKTYVIMKSTEDNKYNVITNLSKKDKVLTKNDDGGYEINDLNITLRNTLKNEIDSGYLNYLFVMEGYYVAKQSSPNLSLEEYKEMDDISNYVNNGFNKIENENTKYNVWSCIDIVEETLKSNITKRYSNEEAFSKLTLVLDDLMNLNLEKKSLDSLQSDLENVQTFLNNNSADTDTNLQTAKNTLEMVQDQVSSIQQFGSLSNTLLSINDNFEDVQELLDNYSDDTDTDLQTAKINLQTAIDYTNKTKDFLDHIRFLKKWFKENTLFSIYSENSFLGNVYKNNTELKDYWNDDNQPDIKIKQICNNFEKNLFYLDTGKNMIVSENENGYELIFCQDLSDRNRILPEGDSFLTTNSTEP